MYVIGGTASKKVAEGIAKNLQFPLAKIVSRRFPDKELYLRIVDDISGEDVLIVQTTYPDSKLVELFLLQDATKEAHAKSVTVLIPYFGYARQDKKFELGEPVSAKVFATLISLNADRVLTVDPHQQHILDFFSVPAFSCSGVPPLAQFLQNKHIEMTLAPDRGALERARLASDIINCEFDYLEKTRVNGQTVKITPKNLDVRGKNIAIIDDIISTGGTMAKAIEHLKREGAKKIYVACIHGLFAGDAIKRLTMAECEEIISTDTICSKYSKVSIVPSIAQLLSSLNG
jgi:ribose-phosphate pyrophosphokinase